MSIKNPKNLLIIGAVAVVLVAGTVLLANYTNALSSSSDDSSQTKVCQKTAQATGGCGQPNSYCGDPNSYCGDPNKPCYKPDSACGDPNKPCDKPKKACGDPNSI